MTEDTFTWTPPAGMDKPIASGWRTFYRHVFNTYGITPEEYRAIYLAQRGRCYVCRSARGVHPDDPRGRGGRRLAVDHNHAVGYRRSAVRALVCSGGDRTCNRILGWLNTPEAFQRGAQVLAEAPAQHVLEYMRTHPEMTDNEITGGLTDLGSLSHEG
jgi:hypothetical protein